MEDIFHKVVDAASRLFTALEVAPHGLRMRARLGDKFNYLEEFNRIQQKQSELPSNMRKYVSLRYLSYLKKSKEIIVKYGEEEIIPHDGNLMDISHEPDQYLAAEFQPFHPDMMQSQQPMQIITKSGVYFTGWVYVIDGALAGYPPEMIDQVRFLNRLP